MIPRGLLLLAMVAVTAPAHGTFRCGSALVDEGDWPVEVRERCGDPDYQATYPSTVLPGLGVVSEVEHWYYNPGPGGFIRRLEFRNGRLHREDSLGYGFRGDSPGSCSPEAIQSGTSEFEVVARCGEPLSRQLDWEPASGGRVSSGPSDFRMVQPVSTWLYEFGDNRFRRTVTLKNGRVTRVETRKKPR